MNLKSIAVCVGVLAAVSGAASAGIRAMQGEATRFGRGSFMIGAGNTASEGFDFTALHPGLRVQCETPNGGYLATSDLPSVFSPDSDAFGFRFGGLLNSEHLLLNTRTNQTFAYSSIDDYGDLTFFFDPPVVVFSAWMVDGGGDAPVEVFVNGVSQTGSDALGVDLTVSSDWNLSLFADGPDVIESVRLHPIANASGKRMGVREIAYGIQPSPQIIAKGFPPSKWFASTHELGMGSASVESFEDVNLAPGLSIEWNAWFGSGAANGTLVALYQPKVSSLFRQNVWSGGRSLAGGVNNVEYPLSGDWADVVLRFDPPVRRVGFSVAALNQDARLHVNDRDVGSIATLGGFAPGLARQGYLRLQAQGGHRIENVRLATGFLPRLIGRPVYIDQVTFGDGCLSDFNDDTFVDDTDFVDFARGYNLLWCDDPAGAPGCPADVNGDGLVDDADFGLFVVSYDAVLCP